MFVCGSTSAPSGALRVLTELATCCLGAAEGGPLDCTCWEPEYDLEQSGRLLSERPIVTRAVMCADCAYRPDSPERSGDERFKGSEEGELERIAALEVFWCHQGMRKPVRWRHRLGIVVEAATDAYEPPMRLVDDEPVPFKADGSPGDRCAGWAAHRRALSTAAASVVAEIAES